MGDGKAEEVFNKSMHIINILKKELFYSGLSKEEFEQVKQPVCETNRKNLIAWAISTGLLWAVSLFIYASPAYDKCRIIFAIAIGIDVFVLLCALFFVKKRPQIIYPLMYLFELSALVCGIALAMAQPDVRTTTMIAMVIIIPTCCIDRIIITIVLELLTIIAYKMFGESIIRSDIFNWGLENLIIFSIAGVLVAHVINKSRFERFVYADSTKKLADIQKNYNKELKKEVDAKTEHILKLHNTFVMGMATMVESRDNSTGGHIHRTSEGVRILVEKMQEEGRISAGFFEKLIEAAPLHDLGKITVDDEILRKPGRFTQDEYNIMKTHTTEGARIIHDILRDTDSPEFRQIAENVAHYHHERVDGSGYPMGLKGDEIPLEARIMAIADVYDALVSKRVYKESYSFEKANQIILDGMGTQFDPSLQPYYEAARPSLEAYYKKELLNN